MGLFDFIGDLGTQIASPFKNLTGIDVSTSGVKFGTPFAKMNIGDVLALGSMFAAPGFKVSSFGDLGKLGTANLAKNFGTAGLLQQAGLGDLKDIGKWNTTDFLTKGLPLAQGLSGAFGGSQGGGQGGGMSQPGYDPRRLYQESLRAGYDALTPSGAQRTADVFQGNQDRVAARRGRLRAADLRRKGYGSGAQAGELLAALNLANEAGTGFRMKLSDPAYLADLAMRRAKLMSPGMTGAYDVFDADMQERGNRIAAGRPKSQFEQLVDIAGQWYANRDGGGGGGRGLPAPPLAGGWSLPEAALPGRQAGGGTSGARRRYLASLGGLRI